MAVMTENFVLTKPLGCNHGVLVISEFEQELIKIPCAFVIPQLLHANGLYGVAVQVLQDGSNRTEERYLKF